MYTQCPACKTVFRLHPDQLNAAKGRVRCSRCHYVFKALDNLFQADPAAANTAVNEKPAIGTETGKPGNAAIGKTQQRSTTNAAPRRVDFDPSKKQSSQAQPAHRSDKSNLSGMTVDAPRKSNTEDDKKQGQMAAERRRHRPTNNHQAGNHASKVGSDTVGTSNNAHPASEKPTRPADKPVLSKKPVDSVKQTGEARQHAEKNRRRISDTSRAHNDISEAAGQTQPKRPTEKRPVTEKGKANDERTLPLFAEQEPGRPKPITPDANRDAPPDIDEILQLLEPNRAMSGNTGKEKAERPTAAAERVAATKGAANTAETSTVEPDSAIAGTGSASVSEKSRPKELSPSPLFTFDTPLAEDPAPEALGGKTATGPGSSVPQSKEAPSVSGGSVSSPSSTLHKPQSRAKHPNEELDLFALDDTEPSLNLDDDLLFRYLPEDEGVEDLSEEEGDASGTAEARSGYTLPLEQETRRGSLTGALIWTGGIMLMLTGLALQYVYYHRVGFAEEPRLRPLLAQMCRFTDCRLPPQRDLTAIELNKHLIQLHPRYNDSLLITATLVNRAEFAQPFPIVEVIMTDLEQKTVARRRFLPREYQIGGSGEPMLAPTVEVPLMLEVLDPGKNAVGFEFNFY